MSAALRNITARVKALSPNETALADLMAGVILHNVADLGDEQTVVETLLREVPNEIMPRAVMDRLFDEALERARARQQSGADFHELIGGACA